MKLLLDQGLPHSTVEKLKQVNIESIHVGDIGIAVATDVLVIDHSSSHLFIIKNSDPTAELQVCR